jgi:acetone carboxylase gamma subunit
LLDDWLKIAQKAHQEGSAIQYQIEESSPPRRLLYEFLHPEIANLHDYQQKFRANRSMRDVEPSVEVFVKNLNDWEDK